MKNQPKKTKKAGTSNKKTPICKKCKKPKKQKGGALPLIPLAMAAARNPLIRNAAMGYAGNKMQQHPNAMRNIQQFAQPQYQNQYSRQPQYQQYPQY